VLKNAFQLLSPDKSFIVCADTPEAKESWMSDLSNVVDSFTKIDKTHASKSISPRAPVRVPANKTKKCRVCSSHFGSLVWKKKKYYCVLCGHFICPSCCFQPSVQELTRAHHNSDRICVSCSTTPGKVTFEESVERSKKLEKSDEESTEKDKKKKDKKTKKSK